MNNKGQFFIISVVIISVSLTVILGLLTIPPQLTTNNLNTQTRNLQEFKGAVNNIKVLGSSVYEKWPAAQTHAATFQVKNNNKMSALNSEVILSICVDDFAENNSFKLAGDSRFLDASFSLINPGELVLGFRDSFEQGEVKTYHVYYNTQTDALKEFVQEDILAGYSETVSELTFYSPVYEAVFLKSNGVLSSLTVKGDDADLVSGFKARVRTGSDYEQDLMSASFQVVSFENNVLILNISGFIESNVYLTQNYFLNPSFIALKQDFSIKSAGVYNLSFVLDTTSNINSLAYKEYANHSLSLPAEALFDSLNHHTLFNNNSGIGVFYKDDSLSTVQAVTGVDSRVQLSANSYNPNIITQNIILLLYYNSYNYSIITGNNYNTNPFSCFKSSRTDFENFNSMPLIKTMTGSSSIINFESFFNESLNPTIILAKNTMPSSAPFSSGLKLRINDINTITLTRSNGLSVPFGLTTRNYHNSSYTPFYLRNDAGSGVSNTNILFLNLFGDDAYLKIIMNSESLTDELTARVYSSNNTLVLEEVLTPSLEGVFEGHELLVKGYNVSGLYTLNLEGDNVVFQVLADSPLISVKPPLILNLTMNTVLYSESESSFNLTMESLDSRTSQVVVNNSNKLFFDSALNFSATINHPYSNKAPYYFYIKEGVTKISTSLYFSSEDYYLSSNAEVMLIIGGDYLGKNYLNASLSPATTNKLYFFENMSYSDSSKTFTNRDYYWDFDDEIFSFKSSSNWLYSGDFYACIGTYGSCTSETTSFTYVKLLENTSFFKSALFDSDTIKVIVSFFNASNLFSIRLINHISSPFTFGINYRINGDDDTDYKTSFSDESVLSPAGVFHSSNLVQTNGWNYIGKRDDEHYTAIFFNSRDLKQGSNASIIHDDYVRVGLNGFGEKQLFFYIGSDWASIDSVMNSLNNMPLTYEKLLFYDINYNSDNLMVEACMLG